MLYNLILNFNNYTETSLYKSIFFIIVLVLSILSLTLQTMYDKKCDLLGEIIRVIHHFSVFLIYLGYLAPINILVMMLLFSIPAILSWMLTKNICFLTVFENKKCNNPKNARFHDLFYYFPLFNLEKLNLQYRIPLLIMFNIIIFLRLYVYFTNNNKLEIHGHRGARGVYPENSITAFDYAMKINVDVLEMDLNMTKDKNIVIYHDRKIDAALCKNGLSLPIKDLMLSQIKEYNCGAIQNPKFPNQNVVPNQKIPTFIELIEYLNKSNYSNKNTVKMNIEMKTDPNLDTDLEVIEFANILIDILNKYDIKNRIIIQSFDPRAILAVNNIDPSITTSIIIEDKKIDMIELAKKLNANIISPDYTFINKELVDKMHKNGFKVLPWTVNTIDDFKNIIEMGVDGVITDYPKLMMDCIKK